MKKIINSFKKGFTIVELVIVIAVIGILAAVLIPTFSGIMNKANSSADAQSIRVMNISLYNWEILNKRKPASYEEVMTALDEANYCDSSNMYLVACNIKTEGAYLFWDQTTNTVSLLDGIAPQFFAANGDSPNYYNNQTGVGEGKSQNHYGYILSTAKTGDKGEFAKWYIGSIGAAQVQDSVFAVVIKQYDANRAAGLSSATAVTSWYTEETISAGSFSKEVTPTYKMANGATVALTKELFTTAENPQAALASACETANAAAAQEAATYLAGIVSLVNNGVSLAGMELNVAPVEAYVDNNGDVAYRAGKVDLTDAVWTPIADQPRKTANQNGIFQGSLNMGYTDDKGVTTSTTITGLKTNNTYVNQSAELQTTSDCGLNPNINTSSVTGYGYLFNYGLFAFVMSSYVKDASTGTYRSVPAVIENINFQNCDVDLTGFSVQKNNDTYQCFTDSGSLLCGYACGDVFINNVTVGTADNPCTLNGYDAVGILIGRQYSYDNFKGTKVPLSGNNKVKYNGTDEIDCVGKALVITNCTVYATVQGDRRCGGLCGFTSAIETVIFENVTCNVNVKQKMDYTKGDAWEFDVLGQFGGAKTIKIKNCNINGATSYENLHNQSNTALDWNTIDATTMSKKVYIDSSKCLASVNTTVKFNVTGSTIFGKTFTDFTNKTLAEFNAELAK